MVFVYINMMKRTLILFLVLMSLISFTFASNLFVVGEVYEYDKKYFEELFVEVDCNTTSVLNFPANAKNIRDMQSNKLIGSNSLILKGCSNYDFFYELDILENPEAGIYRIERNLVNYANFNYTFQIKTDLEINLLYNESHISQGEIFTDYFDSYKVFTFPNDSFYLLYFKKSDEVHKVTLNTTLHEFEETEVIIISIFFLLLGVGIATIYFKRKEDQITETTVPSYVLEKEEMLILNVIKATPGINQKQIGKELDFSKARVSAIVNNLEQKQLLRREKFGRSFKVFLDKKIK